MKLSRLFFVSLCRTFVLLSCSLPLTFANEKTEKPPQSAQDSNPEDSQTGEIRKPNRIEYSIKIPAINLEVIRKEYDSPDKTNYLEADDYNRQWNIGGDRPQVIQGFYSGIGDPYNWIPEGGDGTHLDFRGSIVDNMFENQFGYFDPGYARYTPDINNYPPGMWFDTSSAPFPIYDESPIGDITAFLPIRIATYPYVFEDIVGSYLPGNVIERYDPPIINADVTNGVAARGSSPCISIANLTKTGDKNEGSISINHWFPKFVGSKLTYTVNNLRKPS